MRSSIARFALIIRVTGENEFEIEYVNPLEKSGSVLGPWVEEP